MLRIRACGLTDIGLARAHNEDCFGIDAENQLAVVADGMGGHSHGEVASRIAVESIQEFVGTRVTRASFNGARPEGSHSGLRQHSRVLRDAVRSAHHRVLGAIREDGSLYGMGTTVVGFLLREDVAAVAHVGDSRVYRLRGGDMELLTQDHTWVNEQVMAGFLSPEQARVHPLKNVITRALGGESDVQVDVRELRARAGDVYLLCSDGLTTMMQDPEILAEVTRSGRSLEQVCRGLIQEANSRGGLDNITVILLAIEEV
ncbi:MAG: Stp1/IreP family PP2C-type Ser/Thr phosphatase [Acidobacteriota bacterium]